MQKLETPRSLQGKITYHSSYCEKHPYQHRGKIIPNPIQNMLINGQVVCPRCEMEKEKAVLEDKYKEIWKQLQADKEYNILFHKSIIEDETILDARFDTYIAKEPEEQRNKQYVLDLLEDYKNGSIFNIVLQGQPGAGKSHLSYSVLYELNQSKTVTCLFIAVEAMIRKIFDSFRNKESRYTEEYFNNLLSTVDYLVLDDLGAESGSSNAQKEATATVQRVLYGIANTRQKKATIITTNLTGPDLYTLYDEKLVSRLMKHAKPVIFKHTTDKRVLPF